MKPILIAIEKNAAYCINPDCRKYKEAFEKTADAYIYQEPYFPEFTWHEYRCTKCGLITEASD